MMNKWDIIIIAVIACIVALAVRKIIKDKKTGKCSCGCCEGNKCNNKK